ncbi:hypothetical protein ACFQ2B_17420 [Streptomyces stramineus]|uniref:Secreted protein n=1 Tax=Streptomyces stramineus TaxID=173861 RepID=A0ABP3KY82_9ACTN
MPKLMVTAAAAAGTALLLAAGTTAATAAPGDWTSKSWSKTVSGAHGSGTITRGDEGNAYAATGTLTVTDTDPKACYTARLGMKVWTLSKPGGLREVEVGSHSAKQCGPGTIDIKADSWANNVTDGPWVTLCKEGTKCAR